MDGIKQEGNSQKFSLNTAVLFLIFNRLDTTKKVFESIKKAKTPRLYIAADGPRENKSGEKEICEKVQEFVMSSIDWDCEVKTLFRNENLGCKYAVSSAIDWFFDNEEMGIILEDDCLPSQSFFRFCEELLVKYKDSKFVGHIGGCNFQKGIKRGDGDYYFSVYNHIWGWATWANKWKMYDVELDNIKNYNVLSDKVSSKKEKKYWNKIFNLLKEKKIDTWDCQWTFTLWNNNLFTILPNTNLISNIGFDTLATHTHDKNNELANLPNYEISFPLRHPSQLARNFEADRFTSKLMCENKSLFFKICKKIQNLWSFYERNL